MLRKQYTDSVYSNEYYNVVDEHFITTGRRKHKRRTDCVLIELLAHARNNGRDKDFIVILNVCEELFR